MLSIYQYFDVTITNADSVIYGNPSLIEGVGYVPPSCNIIQGASVCGVVIKGRTAVMDYVRDRISGRNSIRTELRVPVTVVP